MTEFFCDVMLLDIVSLDTLYLWLCYMVLGKNCNPVLKVAWAWA